MYTTEANYLMQNTVTYSPVKQLQDIKLIFLSAYVKLTNYASRNSIQLQRLVRTNKDKKNAFPEIRFQVYTREP